MAFKEVYDTVMYVVTPCITAFLGWKAFLKQDLEKQKDTNRQKAANAIVFSELRDRMYELDKKFIQMENVVSNIKEDNTTFKTEVRSAMKERLTDMKQVIQGMKDHYIKMLEREYGNKAEVLAFMQPNISDQDQI